MAITVTCTNCGKALQAKDEWAGKSVRCPGCKEVIKVPSLKAGGPPPMPAKAPVKRPRDEEEELEEEQPVAKRRRDEEEDEDEAPVRKKKKKRGGGGGEPLPELKEFSPVLLLVLSFFTGGLFAAIWISMIHGKLPKERDNDPSFGTALIFLIVPFLNLFYGAWFALRRLALRINEQREQHNLDPDLSDPLVPMIVFLLCYPIGALWLLVWTMQMQTKVNELIQAANG